ncbi:hypothetical protein GH984_10435 [Spiribacter sp. C176]|uniref:TolC family protein n=1 Tax=Spiribacter salilacus TaxID=2664894 RepID=A0A6N7QRD3_9GAMM|nr:TolC family protein [Spiribacter salilacus]MRH79115.1 hypothetical protein [Spiribacter salilacus]
MRTFLKRLTIGSVVLAAPIAFGNNAAQLDAEALERALRAEHGGALAFDPSTAVQWALLRNTDVLIAAEDIEIGEQRVEAEKGGWQPEFFANVERSETERKNSLDRPDRPVLIDETSYGEFGIRSLVGTGAEITLSYEASDRFSNASSGDDPDGFDDVIANVRFEIRQPLLRGRGAVGIKGAVQQAKHQLDIAHQQMQRRLLDSSFNVLRTYWQMYRAQRTAALTSGSVANAEALLEDSRRLVLAGRLPQSAIDDAESGLLVRQAELAAASQQVSQSQAEMRRLLDVDPVEYGDWEFEAAAEPDIGPINPPEDFSAYVAQVLDIWPSYQIANKQVAIGYESIKMVQDDRRSSLDLILSYGQNARSFENSLSDAFDESFESEYPEWVAGIEWSTKLGGSRRGRAEEAVARAQVRQSQLEAKAIRGEVGNQLMNRLNQVSTTYQELQSHNDNVMILNQLLQRERTAFERGESSVRAVLGREDALNIARLRAIDAEVRYELAKSSLRLSDGTLLDELGVELEVADEI